MSYNVFLSSNQKSLAEESGELPQVIKEKTIANYLYFGIPALMILLAFAFFRKRKIVPMHLLVILFASVTMFFSAASTVSAAVETKIYPELGGATDDTQEWYGEWEGETAYLKSAGPNKLRVLWAYADFTDYFDGSDSLGAVYLDFIADDSSCENTAMKVSVQMAIEATEDDGSLFQQYITFAMDGSDIWAPEKRFSFNKGVGNPLEGKEFDIQFSQLAGLYNSSKTLKKNPKLVVYFRLAGYNAHESKFYQGFFGDITADDRVLRTLNNALNRSDIIKIEIPLNLPAPSADLSLASISGTSPIDYNCKPTLSWTVNDVDSCSANGGWSGSLDSSNGTHSKTLLAGITNSTTYGLSCSKNLGSAIGDGTYTDNVTVGVKARPTADLKANGSDYNIDVSPSSNIALTWTRSSDWSYCDLKSYDGSNTVTIVSNAGTTGSATVTMGSAGSYKTFSLSCSNSCGYNAVDSQKATVVSTPVALTASCFASPSTVGVGDNVTFTATASNGKSPYTYSWSGADSLSGTSQTVTNSYSTTGTKDAKITVTDSSSPSQKAEYSCPVTVTSSSSSSSSSGGGGYNLEVIFGSTNGGSGRITKWIGSGGDAANGTKTWYGLSTGAEKNIVLQATSDTGSTFGGWNTTANMGNCTDNKGNSGTISTKDATNDTCSFTLIGDKSLSVSFNQSSPTSSSPSSSADSDTYNLTFKTSGSGSGNATRYAYDDTWGWTDSKTMNNGDTHGIGRDWKFKLVPNPSSGSYFSSWSGCSSVNSDNECLLEKNPYPGADKTVTVTFSSSSGPGGPGGGGGGNSVKAYISAQNTVVSDGNNTIVTWTSDNAASCEQDEGGSDTGWLSASDTTLGSYTTSNFTTSGGPRTYKVTCINGSQSADAEVTVSVGDYMGSPSVNMWADLQSVGYKKTSMIQWLSSNVFPNSCLLYSVSDTMNGYLAYFNFPSKQYFGPGYYKSEIGRNNATGQATGKLSADTTYKIQCKGYGPSYTEVTAQTTVAVAKPVSNFTLTNPAGASLVATIVEGLSANSGSIALTLSGEAIGNVNLSASILAISGAKAQFSSDNGTTWSDTLSVDISAISQVKIKAFKIHGATAAGTYNAAITATDIGTGGKTKKLNVNLQVDRVSSEWEEF